jgi:hypothetical protein
MPVKKPLEPVKAQKKPKNKKIRKNICKTKSYINGSQKKVLKKSNENNPHSFERNLDGQPLPERVGYDGYDCLAYIIGIIVRKKSKYK